MSLKAASSLTIFVASLLAGALGPLFSLSLTVSLLISLIIAVLACLILNVSCLKPIHSFCQELKEKAESNKAWDKNKYNRFAALKDVNEAIVKLEEKFENALEETQSVLRSLPDPFYLRDMDRNITYWNDAVAQLTGYTAEEVKNMKCDQIFQSSACPDCPTENYCMKTKENIIGAEITIKHKNGHNATILASIAGLYDKDGNPVGAIELFKDLTEQKNILRNITNSAEQVASIAKNLADVSDQVSQSSEEIAATISTISENSQSGANLGQKARAQASDGQQSSQSTINKMKEIEEVVNSSSQAIEELNEKGKEIEQIISLIKGISDQTNLLALNAAIEAARAGDAGRGFAVVAEEVRKLAEESKLAADQISLLVKDVQLGTQQSQTAMEQVKVEISNGATSINTTISALSEIVGTVIDISNTISQIAAATQQAAAATEEETASMEQVASAALNLSEISEHLKDELQRFTF